MTGYFLDELQCRVVRITYNFEKRQGVLEMPDENCPDMTGCIALFSRIDQAVQAIVMYAGSRVDMAYLREGEEWQCRVIPRLE